MRKTLDQIMTESAIEKAQWIYTEGRTVGLTCDNMRRSLKRMDAKTGSEYYGRGASCYHTFVTVLTREVDRLYRTRNLICRYTVPKWDDPINLSL